MSTTIFSLTNTFTPPASCLSTVYQYSSGPNTWGQLGPSTVQSCLPPNYQLSSDFYYSPGVCPSSYTQACSSSVVVGSLTETRATCCPSDFNCQTQSVYPFYSTLGCTLISDVISAAYVFSSATTTTIFTGALNAYGVQIRWQSTDFPTTLAGAATKTVTTTTTPTGLSLDQGLTTGGKVGIGLGIPLAIIFIGLLIWIGLMLRKREMRRTEPTTQEGSVPRFQDTFLPAHAGTASQPHPVGELPELGTST